MIVFPYTALKIYMYVRKSGYSSPVFFIRGSTKVAQYVQSCKVYWGSDNDTDGRLFFDVDGLDNFIHLLLIIAYNIQLVQNFYLSQSIKRQEN